MMRFGMAAAAIVLVPALMAAQTDSSRMRDSSRRAGRQEQTSAGSISRSRRNRLNHDQVTQLQTALQQMGCNPGSIDGVMGRHTQQAEACARQKNNITSNDPQALYQSLNLSFTPSDTGAASARNGARRGTRMRGDSTRMRRSHPDSARHRGSATGRPDSTRRP